MGFKETENGIAENISENSKINNFIVELATMYMNGRVSKFPYGEAKKVDAKRVKLGEKGITVLEDLTSKLIEGKEITIPEDDYEMVTINVENGTEHDKDEIELQIRGLTYPDGKHRITFHITKPDFEAWGDTHYILNGPTRPFLKLKQQSRPWIEGLAVIERLRGASSNINLPASLQK